MGSLLDKMEKVLTNGSCFSTGLACSECPAKKNHCNRKGIIDFARKYVENHKESEIDNIQD